MMRVQLSKQNQRGQMAIFVALIFQILFVFFAMAINIGLVVHDKINLQNAVDLAAYYAAQRQAEMLNVIAHTNYQIRQSWKLLNWRYYVLGNLGSEQPIHPAHGGNYPRTDGPPPLNPEAKVPGLCITQDKNWILNRRPGNDNPCKSQKFSVPNIPDIPNVAPFNPLNALFQGFVRSTQKSIADSCNSYAGINWFFGASIYASYLKDQQSRKELIRALAINLAKSPAEMIDLDGDSIYKGAQKTFQKNLTFTNFNPNDKNPPQIEIYNSLEGLSPNKWLSDLDVWFTMYYQELRGSGSSCETEIKPIYDLPANGEAREQLKLYLGDSTGAEIEELRQYAAMGKTTPAGSSLRMALGVEKNPWYLAYVGVKAKTKPRQLFFPFGEPVEFEARAFAQPFGGRIGPWFGKSWARGADSSGGDQIQMNPPKLLANGFQNSNDPAENLPRYSKYPGDKMGLRSFLAQNSLVNLGGLRANLNNYADLNKGFGPGMANDLVAFSEKPQVENIRNFEIAAIAPDLFDITYYSIQPNFGERYLKRLIDNRNRLGLVDKAYPRGDLGSRGDAYMSVQKQIEIANGDPKLQADDVFWYVRDKAHLLTSWVHNDTYGEYAAFPEKRFGKCAIDDSGKKMPAPGACLDRGGRAGYSVKIISPKIFTTPLSLGGPGQTQGEIMNPPPEDW